MMRATSDEPRTTSGDLRAVSVGLRFGRRATASGDKAPDDRRRAAGHAPRATACVRPRAAVYGPRATQAASDEPWATRLANPGDLLGSNKPMMLVATNCAEDHRPARGDSISASRWADNGRRTTGLGSPQRRRGRRGENSFSDGNGRRPEAHESGQRATFNGQRSGEWRVTATTRVLRKPRTTGRRATRAPQPPRGEATRDDATRDFADTERRGVGAAHPSTPHREATGDDATPGFTPSKRRGDGRRFRLHLARTAATISPRTTRRRATRGKPRATSGVPNKPMMLTATTFTKDRRPARGGSISAGRWAASDGGGVGGRQELGGWTAAAGGERRQRATSNERRPEEHELGQRATFHEQRSGERRVASDERRVASNGDEQRGGERRTAGNAATRDGEARRAHERRGGGLRATGAGRRAAWRETAIPRACPTSRWC